MRGNKDGSVNLFIGITLAIVMFMLASLPVFAGTSTEPTHSSSEIITPTNFTYISHDRNQNNPTIPTHTPGIISTASPVAADPTSLTTAIGVLTDTLTPGYTSTAILSPSSTFTPTPSLPAMETPVPQNINSYYFPFIAYDLFIPTFTPTPGPPRPEPVLYCDNLSQPVFIPDDNANGINDEISISDGRILVSLRLYLNISHSWVGDLLVTLTNQDTGEKITVLDRPGPSGTCSGDGIITVLDDGAAQYADAQCAVYPYAISGIFQPSEILGSFAGKSVAGSWKLNVSDRYPNDTGYLNRWCLETRLADIMPPPTPAPTPVNLPSSAYVNGMSGQDQQFNLDCESRSAVDWAKHFGFNIDELDFLYHLPASDDPEAGFVGDPDGIWGYIPPRDYGVHALPISKQLQDYGVTANSSRSLRWDDLRAEIASGHPAIVWIIGGSSFNLVNGVPYFYTAASTGNTTIVAPHEHTVIVVGYDSEYVTVLNGSRFVKVRLDQFLDSWSVLQFMGILSRP